MKAADPQHPGALHFYIHAVEATPTPERAEVAADELGDLVPVAGHLVHMPAHIYLRVGRYHDAVTANELAATADEDYIAQCNAQGFYPAVYYPHNLHFLWYAAMMEGQKKLSLDTARKMAQHVPLDFARSTPEVQQYLPVPIYTLVRFGLWDDMLKEPAPPEGVPFATAMWHYGRGVAFAHKGDLANANVELKALKGYADLGTTIAIQGKPDIINGMVSVATDLVTAAIANAHGDHAAEVAALEQRGENAGCTAVHGAAVLVLSGATEPRRGVSAREASGRCGARVQRRPRVLQEQRLVVVGFGRSDRRTRQRRARRRAKRSRWRGSTPTSGGPGSELMAAPSRPRRLGFHTRAVHAGARPEPVTGARAIPIFQTTSYVFEDSDAAAAYFNLQEYGNTYSRIMNPTVAAFEERIANLEGGVGGVAFASGLAAQTAALFTLLEPGDHVVASSALYGGTVTQLKHLLRKLSVDLTFVDPDRIDAWRAALTDKTKLLFGETIGNPAGNVLDIEALAQLAHDHGAPLMIDNTFATPYLCRPIEWGADIVVHSATKFIGGHGTSIGGVVVDAGRFDWSNGRYPIVAAPSPAYHGLAFHETFGMYGYLMKLRAETLRDLGAALAPLNAFLFMQGLETLPLRMKAHVANATAVARFLASDARVERVRYAGLDDSPYRASAREVPAARRRRGVLLRSRGRPRRRTHVHRRAESVFASRQRRRREIAGDSSGEHHAPSAQRCRARGGRHRTRHHPAVDRHRGCRRSDLGSATGPRCGGR